MTLYMDGDLHGNAVERLAYMLYTQLSFEMNAFIHQAGTMLRMRDINTYEEFMDELHDLIIWDFVEAMLEFDADEVLKEIETLSKEDIKVRGTAMKRKLHRLATDIL
jgi:hypothetical protein